MQETILRWYKFAEKKPDGRQPNCFIAGHEVTKNMLVRSVRCAFWDQSKESFIVDNDTYHEDEKSAFVVEVWAYIPTLADVKF